LQRRHFSKGEWEYQLCSQSCLNHQALKKCLFPA
jgi:hypothetical protein